MTWYTRSDILEIFRDAQDSLVRKSYARCATRPEVAAKRRNLKRELRPCAWWGEEKERRHRRYRRDKKLRIVHRLPKLKLIGDVCVCCNRRSTDVIHGHALCSLHAKQREAAVRGSVDWNRRTA